MIGLNRTVIEQYLPNTGIERVAHYTRIANLVFFLPHGSSGWTSLFASPVQFLNDRNELTLGLSVLHVVANQKPRSSNQVRNRIVQLIKSNGDPQIDVFQTSFSANPDELGQWRGYGDNGMGCSIETSVPALHSVSNLGGWIIYDFRKQRAFSRKILEHLRLVNDDAYISRVLLVAASFMKHPGFESEQEYRVITFPDPAKVKFRDSGQRIVPYVDFLSERIPSVTLDISRIRVGPGWQLSNLRGSEFARHHVVLGISRLLEKRGLPIDIIEPSKIPYDPR